jgi:hypothetical protein
MMRRVALASFLALSGCSSEDSTLPPPAPPVPTGCADAAELELPDGRCIRPGIAPDACAEGFAHDGGYGCEPILPPAICSRGLMAVPGDDLCRPVMPCGAGRWGGIPVEPNTQYVDQSFSGASDGSERAPWQTIGEAFAAAGPGAILALAAGSYVEDVVIQNKPVRLWGVCPEQVSIAGTGAELAAVNVHSGASGTEVRGVALTGAGMGLYVNGSENVRAEGLWIHGTADWGLSGGGSLGPASLSIVNVLIEASPEIGLLVAGVPATVEAVEIRGDPFGQPGGGRGIALRPGSNGAPAVVTLRRSLIELSRDVGIDIAGCEAIIEGTVVRDTQAATGPFGLGIQVSFLDAPSLVTLRGSLVERSRDENLYLSGSQVTVETTVVRDNVRDAGDPLDGGRGIGVQPDPVTGAPGFAMVKSSLVDRNMEFGVHVGEAEAIIESTVVRNGVPRRDGLGGRGINIQAGRASGVPSVVTVRDSLVDHNSEVGIFVAASQITLESSVVRDTLPQQALGVLGRGVSIEPHIDTAAPSQAVVLNTLVDRSYDVGLLVGGSQAQVEGCIVRDTLPRSFDGIYGDGVVVISLRGPASLEIAGSRIEASARAGLANFGAFAALAADTIQCSGFDLEGESFEGQSFSFEDRGANGCGCPEANLQCEAVSAGLAPPDPID